MLYDYYMNKTTTYKSLTDHSLIESALNTVLSISSIVGSNEEVSALKRAEYASIYNAVELDKLDSFCEFVSDVRLWAIYGINVDTRYDAYKHPLAEAMYTTRLNGGLITIYNKLNKCRIQKAHELAHELAHAIQDRATRFAIVQRETNSAGYALNEVIAEFVAWYLMRRFLGYDNLGSVAYIDVYKKQFGRDLFPCEVKTILNAVEDITSIMEKGAKEWKAEQDLKGGKK